MQEQVILTYAFRLKVSPRFSIDQEAKTKPMSRHHARRFFARLKRVASVRGSSIRAYILEAA